MSVEKEISEVLPRAEALAASLAYEILKIEMVLEQGQRILRIFLDNIDHQKGILIEDCAKFSRALSPILDVEVSWIGNYHLEVSSPGLNRPLRTLNHYLAQVGNIVEISTEETFEGRKNFKGELLAVNPDTSLLQILVEGQDFEIPLNSVKKARLDYFATEAKHSPEPLQKKGRGKKT